MDTALSSTSAHGMLGQHSQGLNFVWFCVEPGAGLGDPCGSLPTQAIPWFYDLQEVLSHTLAEGQYFHQGLLQSKVKERFLSGLRSEPSPYRPTTGRVLDDLLEMKLNSQLFNLRFSFISGSLLRGEYMAASFFNSIYSMLHFTMH